MHLSLHCRVCLMIAIVIARGPSSGAEEPLNDRELAFFESSVRPLLVENCYECHSQQFDESSGGLRLDTAAAMTKGGISGPALVAGDPERSLIMNVVSYDGEMQMPPDGKLDDDSIALLRQWIKIGAPDPRTQDGQALKSQASKSPMDFNPQDHWAFVTPQFPGPPPVPNGDSVGDISRDVIDDWASDAAKQNGVTPNLPADDDVLIRRLYFDLNGVPPSVEDIDEFVNSGRPDKLERLVDALLAAPEFGERFGRHWLDVARYADTVGYALAEKERRFTGSHLYRDWVIAAFGSDMPYDEMVRHQITGDRTDPENESGNLDAMGFLTLGRQFLNGLDKTDDQIDVITRGLLGMTVTCARCHDHKFDPIPAADYYSIFGMLKSSEEPDDGPSPLMMRDSEKTGDRRVFLRGQPGNQGPVAPRQFLTALRKPDEPRFRDGSGRMELAQRITEASNPLFARVMVNRIWDHLIGRPLVDSPSDFGVRTEAPRVPQVLDDLSADFARDFSIKRLVRRIVMTRIYKQDASVNQESITGDPENELLARANRRRRDLESLRDSLLAVADSLDRKMGGGSVEISLPSPVPRRTVYAMIDRQNLPAIFRTFDFADPNAHSPRRYFTTVPQQGLFLINSPQVAELSRRTAQHVRARVTEGTVDDVTRAMFRQVLSRDPSDDEIESANAFLEQPVEPLEMTVDPRFAWSYGTGKLRGEEDERRVEDFKPFDVFTGDRWQVASDFPVAGPLGYAFLSNEHGHAPHDPDTVVVRRFTAPISGTLRIAGQMGHRAKEGDGVEISILIGGRLYHHSVEKSSNRPFGPSVARIEAGQTVDIVAGCGKTDSHDSFFVRANLRLSRDDGSSIGSTSIKDFSGSLDPPATEPA